jgi:two-component system, cell cycle sensor histidine kinase and response regulator CckA
VQAPLAPHDEAQRLQALRAYRLDALAEPAFDDLTALAAHICDTPISLISLVDDTRQWFKSSFGMALIDTSREASFCAHAILEPDVFVVPDTALDQRFADNPLVTGILQLRFYAGVPLVTAEGHALGALCVMDYIPRALLPSQHEALRVLGQQVMAQLDLRRQTHALHDSEARLRLVTDNSRVGLVAVDRDHRYVYANDAYAHILELPSPVIVGLLVRDVLRDVYEEQIRPRLDQAFAGIRTTDELHKTTAHGDEHYGIRYEPADVEGAVRLVVVVITDITEHKIAALASRRLAAIVESSNDAIIGLDLSGIITSWNRAAEELFGYQAGEIVGASMVRLIPADRKHEEGPIFERIKRGERVQHFETQRQTKDGRLIDVSITMSPVEDMTGRLIGASKMARDISERSGAADAVRVAEERMRFALNNANVGIWDMDYVTGVLQWSETLEAQYGLEPGTFGSTFGAFIERVHPDDRAGLREQLEQATQSGAVISMDHRTIWPDGKVRWLSGAGRVLLDAHGEPRRGLGISLDVTERHTLEAQYQQAQRMEAVGRLAGGVAHDFNNLLTAILGYCELLLGALNASDPLRNDVLEIQRAGLSAAGLTRQLLAFSRKQIIEPTRFDLNGVVVEMRAMLGRIIGEDVAIVLGLRAGATSITADRGQVEQIILNLSVNARDAMPTGGTLTIETSHVALDEDSAALHFAVKPGTYVTLTVTDTGMGMTPEVQSHLFEPFFTTKDLGKGTGLGLATVHGIVARCGGTVSVYSEVGKGTSFKAYFPLADPAEAVIKAPAPVVRRHVGAHAVLVVEDAPGLRELTRRLLEREGYAVHLAANAKEALRLFEQHESIDVVLTDVVMPGASGPELTQQLVERRPALKVIYMSGYTEEAIVQHGVLRSGIAFLHKPFSSDTLTRKLREVLDEPE